MWYKSSILDYTYSLLIAPPFIYVTAYLTSSRLVVQFWPLGIDNNALAYTATVMKQFTDFSRTTLKLPFSPLQPPPHRRYPLQKTP